MIVNGPEDGTEFPIVRGPVRIGSDASSAVVIRLDPSVRQHHALATVVSDGYRIRRTGGAPVYVDDKRAGMLFSRIARSGSLVQVGHTLLCVECAPGGLASRRRGTVSESDLGWAVQQGVRILVTCSRVGASFGGKLLAGLLRRWYLFAAGAVLLFFLVPGFKYRAIGIFYYLKYHIPHLFSR